MNYEAFRLAWRDRLVASGLQRYHGEEETIELRSLDRRYQCFAEPHVGQDAEPWFVTTRLAWRWSSLQSARTATTEEDLLTELFDRDESPPTVPPWLRVDVELFATLPFGCVFLVPEVHLLRSWRREIVARLEQLEPLLPLEIEASDAIGLTTPGWLSAPTVEADCDSNGRLVIQRVSIESWQPLLLPRIWDDPERADEPAALDAFFARVRAALYVWMQCLDHLKLSPP